MKYCPDCKQDKADNLFYRKSEHCMACNENYCRNVMDLDSQNYPFSTSASIRSRRLSRYSWMWGGYSGL